MLLSNSAIHLKAHQRLGKSRLARDAEAAVCLMCFQGHWKKSWSPKYFPARRLKLHVRYQFYDLKQRFSKCAFPCNPAAAAFELIRNGSLGTCLVAHWLRFCTFRVSTAGECADSGWQTRGPHTEWEPKFLKPITNSLPPENTQSVQILSFHPHSEIRIWGRECV